MVGRPHAPIAPAPAGALLSCLLVAALLAGAWLSTAALADPPEPIPLRDPALADATLHDVAFVDAQQGWAVGDRGAIWHTGDGGQHWQLQTSGVDCPLLAVAFVDRQHGFAAGGSTRPFSHASHGVWLETRDGGEHWRLDRTLMLPSVRAIKFFDHEHGWAITGSSALFPSGVFSTQDGGKIWSAVSQAETNAQGRPTTLGASWLAGDFTDLNSGVLAGRTGALGSVRRHGIESARTVDFGLRSLCRVRMASATEGWLVGDGGLVLHTPDLGLTWQLPTGELPEGTSEHFDFQALAVRPSTEQSQRCWLAGSPGTRVFFSGDGGRSWQIGNTGQTLPIRSLAFVDDWHGWAVGDLGLILSTEDGGRTWQRQQSGGRRAALAGFYAHGGEVPWELVAQLSGDEGYLSTIEVITRPAGDQRADLAELAHEATVVAGGSVAEAAWQFPVREAGLRLSSGGLVEDWNLANDGHALDRLDAYLVRQLRIWRPSVVVIAGSAPPQPRRAGSGAEPAPAIESSVIAQAVLAAVERAADPTRHSGQIVSAGLQAWKVDKVFSSLPDGKTAALSVNTAQISSRAQRPLAEVAQAARGLVAMSDVTDYQPPAVHGFRLLVDRLPQGVGTRDFFSGIAISPGGDARRQMSLSSGQGLDQLKRMAQARRNLQAILTQAEADQPQAGGWLAEVGQLVRTLDEGSAAEVLFQLGQRYYRQGRWPLAAEAFEMLADRYPQHPLAGAALVWLVQYYSSGEAAWRNRQTDRLVAQQIDTVAAPEADDKAGSRRGQRIGTAAREPAAPARRISATSGLVGPADLATQRAEQAATLAKKLGELDAARAAEPHVGFPLAIAHRRQGYPRQAERFYLTMTRARMHDAWWTAAQSEQWLPSRQGLPPKPLTGCPPTAAKPRLDGKLDDPLWTQARPLELHSARREDAAWSAVAMLAYDNEFLYLAASCRQVEAIRPAAIEKNRQHDADVSTQDRVEFCIDLDRDWTTFYRLSVDQRGCTRDECWHDATWNPRWFVAVDRQDDTWSFEAAVPLVELAGQPPTADQAWALGVVRVAPGVGLQSWSTPAGAEPVGEGFGLLLFQ